MVKKDPRLGALLRPLIRSKNRNLSPLTFSNQIATIAKVVHLSFDPGIVFQTLDLLGIPIQPWDLTLDHQRVQVKLAAGCDGDQDGGFKSCAAWCGHREDNVEVGVFGNGVVLQMKGYRIRIECSQAFWANRVIWFRIMDQWLSRALGPWFPSLKFQNFGLELSNL